MVTILGAGGAIGNGLLKELVAAGERVRLVSRTPRPATDGVETVTADVTDLDQTVCGRWRGRTWSISWWV